jgi:quercetin dioxygenase-like cupin family protein
MKGIKGLIAALFVTAASFGQTGCAGKAGNSNSHAPEAHRIYTPDQIDWKPGPPSLPGVRIAILDGDPAKEGPFAMRLHFPAGTRIMPHWHPKTERVTVLSGTLRLGFGEKFDAAATHALPAGTYGYWTPGIRHFAFAEGETILQLNGIGPWEIIYVNPADDPRKR